MKMSSKNIKTIHLEYSHRINYRLICQSRFEKQKFCFYRKGWKEADSDLDADFIWAHKEWVRYEIRLSNEKSQAPHASMVIGIIHRDYATMGCSKIGGG